ncbi:hypothetical protein [Moraxella osloensis]|uniref:hypothetical protein n=1 Tax=Faucicola osloensis TaxID=34062 RepID=UPI002005F6F6|nr:hypothetical protein [Moraxella osloensis]
MLVSTDAYQVPSDEALSAYNDEVKAYYNGRGIDMDWQAQIASTFGGDVRPFMLEYLQKQGFAKR